MEAEPSVAAEIFGDRVGLARRYTRHLCTTGVDHGLIGPREVPRIWTRHVLNCAVLAELLPLGATVLDLGSGAGLPGVAVAIARPDVSMTLVEPLERRSTWLTTVAEDLGLPLRVLRARAEELAGHERAHVVTARAVAPLAKLAQWGLPLVAADGELLAIKGRTAVDELGAAQGVLRRLGATSSEVMTCGDGLLEEPTTVVRVRVGTHRDPTGSAGAGSLRSNARSRRAASRRRDVR